MVLHMRSHRQVAYLALVAFASILLLSVSLHPPSRAAFTTYVLDKRPSLQWYLPYSSIPCDPYVSSLVLATNLFRVEQPGWPDLQQWYWATANAECPGDADLIHGLSSKTDDLWERFPEFRKKNILLAGDSVGRHLAVGSCCCCC
jgi:hypothetical protein